ncbi:TPA: recombination regulator RecX [Staphylococcus argenteus]|uniref:recombination regulator RecX n=1 Tax=Staphylococcus argenteus TaxID=985002 RepID=UPI00091DBB3A|nr:recombination regulator RecX [Staphylococcus argenteus]MCG9797957.1 recombination regulator RecX [Staphylococcus argenteus]MCG9809449.1 recombination regulator RecX [Staphylococcus argenteus]MCG9813972.1 recombination regulator RecX [Staphylococcus argenteus]MEB1812374.1 recombination regulator RecX [Staphylococcus argenteus]OMH94023.1 RecX family transcriptional regulator [Staphylococcus argenteus]
MPKITKIEVQKKNKERFNLFLDGQFEMGIDIDTLVKFNLKKGQQLEAAEMAQIQKYDHYRLGLNKTIQYLSFKKRTEKEVVQYLQKEEISEQAISEIIEYCYREKLIDHRDYAESLKNTMIRTTDKGPKIYQQKLYQLGIEANIIEMYTALFREQQDFEDIVQIAEKICKTKKGPPSKVKEKVMQSLLQKGFDMDVIHEVMNEMDFSQDEAVLDGLIERDLEKIYNKNCKKYTHQKLILKTIEGLMRKGYKYDKIKAKLEESGIADGTEEIE